MNKRILALAASHFPRDGEGNIHATPEIIGEFAKLIVQECIQTLIDNTPERYTNESAEEDWDKGYDRAMRDCVHHIQEHFGVEE